MSIIAVAVALAVAFYAYGSLRAQQTVSEELERKIFEVEQKLAEVEASFLDEKNRIYKVVMPKKKSIKEKIKGFFTKNKEK